MYLILNKDGSIRESQLNDYINKGSDGVNFIDVAIFEDGACVSPDKYTATGVFLLPDGTTSLNQSGVLNNSITTSLGVMEGYRFYLYSAFTQYAGTLKFSMTALFKDKTSVSYAQDFTINDTAVYKDGTISWEEYENLMKTMGDYQLQYSLTNVIHAGDMAAAESLLPSLAVGQLVAIDDASGGDTTDVNLYAVWEDSAAESGKKLEIVDFGFKGLKDEFVSKLTEKDQTQNVGTGLTSYYTGSDGNKVNYGTEAVSDGNGFFAYVLDGSSNYTGKISLGAKVFEALDASNVAWLYMDNATSYLRSPSATSSVELATGSAKVYGENVYIGSKNSESGEASGEVSIGSGIKVDGSETKLTSAKTSFSGETEFSSAPTAPEPTGDTQLANKAYVDGQTAAAEAYTDTQIGALPLTYNKYSAVGIGFNTSAAWPNSIVIGDNGPSGGNMPSWESANPAVVLGQDNQALFVCVKRNGVGTPDGVMFHAYGGMDVKGSSTFANDATFSNDVYVNGKLSATEFTAVHTTSLDTTEATIGLAKGNTEPISTYIGLYAEKYNGTDYGALVWDKSGTAYVGDVSVDANGKITDPNNTLQPLMTRAPESSWSDCSLMAWDATNLKAVPSRLVNVDSDATVIIGDKHTSIEVNTIGEGIYFATRNNVSKFLGTGEFYIRHSAFFEKDVFLENGAAIKYNNGTDNAPCLLTFDVSNNATKLGDTSTKTALVGSEERPTYNGSDLALLSDIPVEETQTIWLQTTNGTNLFKYNQELTNVKVMNAQNLTTAESMFEGSSIKTLVYFNPYRSNLPEHPLTSTRKMFLDCSSLTSVPLFDTSNVTSMYSMLQACKALTEVPAFNTSNVTDMAFFVQGCISITSFPLLDTSKATTMRYTFNYCPKLTTIPALDASNVTNFADCFGNSPSLEAIHMTGMKVSFDISASTKFTESALVEIIGNLASVTTTQTLTMGETNLAKLTDAEKKVATDKGWTLA